MMRWCGHTKAAPTGMAVVTMGTDIWEPRTTRLLAGWLVCRQSDGTLRRTPGPKSSVRSTKIASRAGYRQRQHLSGSEGMVSQSSHQSQSFDGRRQDAILNAVRLSFRRGQTTQPFW